MKTKDVIYGLGILLTFIIGIWNLISNYRASRRTSFINTVTNQRVKWIEQLRQDIAAFCGLTYTWSISQMEDKPQKYDMLKEIDRLRHVIRLRLNPTGKHDMKIEELINRIPELTHVSKQDELKQSLNELLTTTQALLKEEWEKVKAESKQGDLKD